MKPLVKPYWLVAVMIALAAPFACPVQAQDLDLYRSEPAHAPSTFAFGARIGLVQTEFYGGSVGAAEAGTDLAGGGFLTYRIHPRLAIQPEVLLTRRSGKLDHGRAFPGSRDASYRLGVLDVPLLVKGYLPAADGTMPYVVAGPYASVRLFGEAADVNRVLDDVDVDRELRAWDYGLTAGLGLERAAGRRTLSFDVRYGWGLANLFRDDARPDFRARGLAFSVGLGL